MKINATTLVEELKKEFNSLYNLNIEVLTQHRNIAGNGRKIKALLSREDVEFPVNIESESADGFIRQCKRKMGLKLLVSEEAVHSASFDFNEINFRSTPKRLLTYLTETFKSKDLLGCISFNKNLVNYVNTNPQCYWLLFAAEQTLNNLANEDAYDFNFSLSYFGLNIRKEDLTLYFDEKYDAINSRAPFEEVRDFKWYSSSENKENQIDGGSFVKALLDKTKYTESDFEDSVKCAYLFNFGISSFYVSAGNWTDNNEADSDDVVDGLATMIWTVLGSAGWENETLNEYTNSLPVFVVEDLLGIETDDYNSETNEDCSSYRDYVIDWRSVAENIFEGPGFPCQDNGPLGSGVMKGEEITAFVNDLTKHAPKILSNGKKIASQDLPEKMSIIDYQMISDLFPEGWRMPNNAELKELHSLKENKELNLDLEEVYISTDDIAASVTGILFFDDGEFREERAAGSSRSPFAGKIRLIQD